MVVENVDGTDDTAKPKAYGTEKEREKDSGTDSPGLRVTPPGGDHDNDGGNVDSDPDLRNVEEDEVFDEEYVKGISKLPPGFVRDSQGRIIVRVYQFDLKCKKLKKSYLMCNYIISPFISILASLGWSDHIGGRNGSLLQKSENPRIVQNPAFKTEQKGTSNWGMTMIAAECSSHSFHMYY